VTFLLANQHVLLKVCKLPIEGMGKITLFTKKTRFFEASENINHHLLINLELEGSRAQYLTSFFFPESVGELRFIVLERKRRVPIQILLLIRGLDMRVREQN